MGNKESFFGEVMTVLQCLVKLTGDFLTAYDIENIIMTEIVSLSMQQLHSIKRQTWQTWQLKGKEKGGTTIQTCCIRSNLKVIYVFLVVFRDGF